MTEPRRWQRLRLAAIAATALCGFALILLALSPSSSPSNISEPAAAAASTRRNLGTPAECETNCKDPPIKDLQHFGGDDLMNLDKMMERLKQGRKEYVTRLKKDYGDKNYKNMFEPTEEVVVDEESGKKEKRQVSVGRRRIYADPASMAKTKKPELEELAEGPAWERFVKKLQMKLLQIQLGILEERQNAKAICLDECATEDEVGERFLKQVQKSTGLYSTFTWATGGHSASAGHGNLFRESYTANMDRALTPILKGIGINFETRNYAMGGTDCAEEVALCMNQIFGRDIDSISWDYGMTDGHDLYKMIMYAYKAAGISKITDSRSNPGNIQHRPAFFAIHQSEGHNFVVQAMQNLGMTTLAWNKAYMNEVILPAVPEMMGLTDKQIQNLPPYIQYLKCEGGIEVGEPGCKDNKFNNSLCTTRKARTSWHPGWKMHALDGNHLAVTFLDGFEDAIQGLIDAKAEAQVAADETPDDAKKRLMKQLQALDKEEQKSYANIFEAPIPEELMPHLAKFWSGKEDHLQDVELEAFFKGTSFCHSAILPAQARFHGFVTENFTAVGEIMDQNYEEGVLLQEIQATETPGRRAGKEPATFVNPKGEGQMMLVNGGGRQICEEYLNLDYKDYFHVSNLEGWQTITLPNDSEKKEYSEFDAKSSKGYVLACLVRCDWGKCAHGDVHSYFGWDRPKPRKDEEPPSAEELAKTGKAEITINGEKVTEASDMHTCFAMKNKKGHVWQPNADGRYEIKIRINGGTEYSFVHISSFILV